MLINELSAIVCTPESRRVDKTTILEQAVAFLDNHKGMSALFLYTALYYYSMIELCEFTSQNCLKIYLLRLETLCIVDMVLIESAI